jgi:YesN/AraC family two-component response regulator
MDLFHVLVVDDEIYAVKGIIDGIDWGRLEVSETFEAYNAREAKAILETKPIDLMICDISMPEENGLELLEWAKAHCLEPETLFLTCHADFDYARKALQLGSCDYLLKPVIYEEMEEVLRKNFERIRNKRSNQKNMESYKNYYSIEEKWKSLLESGERQQAAELIGQTLAWIKSRSDSREDRIKIHQSILQIAVYVLRKKGLRLQDLKNLETEMEADAKGNGTGGNGADYTDEQFRQRLESIVSVCCDAVADESKFRENSIVFELKKYIKQNLDKRISREELSEHVHLNESYLSRLFHQKTGMPLSDYILQERMKKAGELMSETDEPISEIANKLCYDNFSYFSKMFRKVHAMTPQEYRKKYHG